MSLRQIHAEKFQEIYEEIAEEIRMQERVRWIRAIKDNTTCETLGKIIKEKGEDE